MKCLTWPLFSSQRTVPPVSTRREDDPTNVSRATNQWPVWLGGSGDLLGTVRGGLHRAALQNGDQAQRLCMQVSSPLRQPLCLSLSLSPSPLFASLSASLSLIHIHSPSPVLVVMLKSKEFKTKIYSHAHSLILSHCGSLCL